MIQSFIWWILMCSCCHSREEHGLLSHSVPENILPSDMCLCILICWQNTLTSTFILFFLLWVILLAWVEGCFCLVTVMNPKVKLFKLLAWFCSVQWNCLLLLGYCNWSLTAFLMPAIFSMKLGQHWLRRYIPKIQEVGNMWLYTKTVHEK